MKLATTIGEVYPFVTSPAEAVLMYKDSGFKYLDYSFYDTLYSGSVYMAESDLLWKKEVEAAALAAESAGFSFVQAHTPAYNPAADCDHQAALRAVIRSLEGCSMLGIRNTVIHSPFCKDYPYPEKMKSYFEVTRTFLEKLLPYAEKYQVTLCVENSCTVNTAGNCFIMTGKEAQEFVSYMDHPNLAAAWDIGHANIQKLDNYQEIADAGKVLRAVHIHDNNALRDDHLAPYCGNIDFDSVVRALKAVGFGGYFCFEAEGFVKYSSKFTAPSPEIKRMTLKILYEIGKKLLETHDCFEN